VRTKYSKCSVVSLFHHLCVETTWRRRTLLLLIRRTSNLPHDLLPIYLYILPLSLLHHIRLPSCALHPRPVPSKPTGIHLPRNATTDNGRSQYPTPAHTDTHHPITALNSQASRSIAIPGGVRGLSSQLYCRRTQYSGEMGGQPSTNFVYTRPTVSGVKMRTDTTSPSAIILWGGGNLSS